MLSRLALTAILLGYFLVWLPQPVTGLSFIGLEMGEWVKFIPEVAGGQILPGRTLFYLPPLTLALLMIVLAADWPSSRWQTWGFRLIAVVVAALALPSVEAILEEPPSEWLLRVVLFAGTVLVAGLTPVWRDKLPADRRSIDLVLIGLGLIGALLPLWAYLAMRPAIGRLIGQPVGLGPGLWLNTISHLAVVALALLSWQRASGARRPVAAGSP
jgi:hypothetical protein